MATTYRRWTISECKTSADIIVENVRLHFGTISLVTLKMVRYLVNNNKTYEECIETVMLWQQNKKRR
jgi:hypothetical protein